MHVLPIFEEDTVRNEPFVPSSIRKHEEGKESLDISGLMLSQDLRLVKKIGAGTFGLIYLVEDIGTEKTYAAKIVLNNPPSKYSSSKNVAENKKIIETEIHSYFQDYSHYESLELSLEWLKLKGAKFARFKEIAFNLRVQDHPNIVKIHRVYDLGKVITVVVMDYFEQGDLFYNIINKQIFLTPPLHKDRDLMMKNAMLQLVEAVQHCESRGVYHCDLKPENIMVEYNSKHVRSSDKIIDYDEIRLVLIDFGLAVDSSTIQCNVCRGSSYYMAPERVMNYNTSVLIKSLVDMNQFESLEEDESKGITKSNSILLPTLAGDIWSLGVLFVNITCARNPWTIASLVSADGNQVFKSYILRDQYVLRSIIPISKGFNRLLNRIFTLDPNKRISLSDLHWAIERCDFFGDEDDKKIRLIKSHDPQTLKINRQLDTPPDTHSTEDSLLDGCNSQFSVLSIHSDFMRPHSTEVLAK